MRYFDKKKGGRIVYTAAEETKSQSQLAGVNLKTEREKKLVAFRKAEKIKTIENKLGETEKKLYV